MLHLISYLILKDVQFDYFPAEEDGGPNVLRFYGRETRYVVYEFHDDTYPNYSVRTYSGTLVVSTVSAIELFDLVAALI